MITGASSGIGLASEVATVVADVASEHDVRRIADIAVHRFGASTPGSTTPARNAPSLVTRPHRKGHGARVAERQQSREPETEPRPDGLSQAAGDGRERSGKNRLVFERSAYTWAALNPAVVAMGLATVAGIALARAGGRRRRG